MKDIQISELRKSFDTAQGELIVFDGINLSIEGGSFTSVIGPSGCGKTTLMNLLAGLVSKDSGSFHYGDTEVDGGEFFYGYVFQEPRLLDWLTVEDNIKFALKSQGIPKQEHQSIVADQLKRVGLAGEEKSYPLHLSGGMRQRVGLARALAIDPDIIFMDEPFGSVDELTARELRDDLLNIWQETDKTILFVTHDIKEAVYLSDKIIILNKMGEIVDEVTVDLPRPRDLEDPALIEIQSSITKTFLEKISH